MILIFVLNVYDKYHCTSQKVKIVLLRINFLFRWCIKNNHLFSRIFSPPPFYFIFILFFLHKIHFVIITTKHISLFYIMFSLQIFSRIFSLINKHLVILNKKKNIIHNCKIYFVFEKYFQLQTLTDILKIFVFNVKNLHDLT